MFIILSKTKLWNFFTDPNPSTRNLYLNIGFVSIPDDTLRMVSNSPKDCFHLIRRIGPTWHLYLENVELVAKR